MLRSMIIGLAIAALLQCGVRSVSPAHSVLLAAQQIDWVQIQTDALAHLVSDGYTLLLR